MTNDRERELRIEQMTIDIKRIEQQIKRLDQEMRWQPYTAIAAILAAAAAMAGVILGIAHLLR
jgi:hypothetical protein